MRPLSAKWRVDGDVVVYAVEKSRPRPGGRTVGGERRAVDDAVVPGAARIIGGPFSRSSRTSPSRGTPIAR